MNNITEALNKRFHNHRVIFWYDEKEELLEQYEELKITDVEKIHVKGNEFEVKYIINKQFPDTKFLLYFTGEKPANEENWLLDMELAHQIFHTDQEAMFLQELGLGYHLKELIAEHIEFFKSSDRRIKLKELLGEGDEHREIRYKMLAVIFETENVSLVTYIHAHGSAFSLGNDKNDKDLKRFNLWDFYWKEISNRYKYQNSSPSIYDFLLELFNNNFVLGNYTKLAKESVLLLALWKDTISYRNYFGKISDKIAVDLDIESTLNKTSIDEIILDDLFQLSDRKIIYELVALVTAESISNEKVIQYAKQRENKFWYNDFENFYQSIIYASDLITLVRKYSNKKYKSFDEGVEHYASILYEIDQVYRKFIWSYRKTNQNKILAELALKVEKVYSNDWLLAYNNNWQNVIDNLNKWPNELTTSQQGFFNYHVKPFIEKNQRLFVIISDAFRYECGVELSKRLQA